MLLLQRRWGRRVLFAALYASEGAPIGYIWWALPTKLRAAGVPIDEVTALTALITLPWAFKFLWAPLVDATRERLGLRRWIAVSQMLMGLSLLPLLASPEPFSPDRLSLLTGLLLLHALSASTQDVSIDALAIASVPVEERGSINGFMQLGMLGARALFGGAALYVERFVGEKVVLGALVGCIWLSLGLVLVAVREPEGRAEPSGGFVAALLGMLRARSTWWAVMFAVIAGAGFKSTGAIAGPLLLHGGLSKESVGLFFSVTAAALALGALGGGRLADHIGRKPAARLLLVALFVSVVATAGASAVGATVGATSGASVLVAALVLLYVAAGAFTAAEYALYMDATDPALGATQFSAYLGAINLCETWSSYAVGQMIPTTGYPLALLAMALVSSLALVALPRVGKPNPFPEGDRELRSTER